VGKNPIVGDIVYIKDFDESTSEVIIDGVLINIDIRDIKDKKLVIFDLYDTTSTITCKFFISNDLYDRNIKEKKLKADVCVRLKGKIQFDTYNSENVIFVKNLELIEDFRSKKQDLADVKRVELHAHTQMSDMDAVVSATDLVEQALQYGHKAIAITDHGVVQAFPDAFHAAEGKDIKIIYGVEGYLVDDEKPTIRGDAGTDFDDMYVVFDIETTGFHPGKDTMTEIGAVKIHNRVIIDRFSTFVNPERDIPLEVQKLTGITPDMVSDAPQFASAIAAFMAFVGDAIMVAHNADFDMGFIHHFANLSDITVNNTSVVTVEMARTLYPDMTNYKLKTLAKNLEVKLSNHHRAV
jgi:DNA polymerase-3 subunit alpha (Gram-positive type)